MACSHLPPVGTVSIRNRATLWRLLKAPDPAFGEGYLNGAIDVSGDLTRLMESVNTAMSASRLRARHPSPTIDAPASTTLASAQHHVHHHYDLGNDFFKLWLDERMVYTCAYFEQPTMSLEAAQLAKLEYVCRKLQLRPGDRVIEAGSGWGALAVYMARHYGVSVRSYNISQEQLAYARQQAAREGVSDRVTFIDGDFRSIAGECDAFVSVGMLEHVGPSEYQALGEVIDHVLEPRHGRGLLHFCGRNQPMALATWTERYIFPGAYAPALSQVATSVLEPWNLSILDVENLRRHYATTLRHWRARFEAVSTQVGEMFDERFVRMWRLYLACAEACFTSGDMQLFQVTFGRATDDAGSWTREGLYHRRAAQPRISH
jgi:cyclopropane-fatty-acyl-phospholipid synthase